MGLCFFLVLLLQPLLYPYCSAVLPQDQALLGEYTQQDSRQRVPIASKCAGYSFPYVACINRYGSIMRGNFGRAVLDRFLDQYALTSAPEDTTFGHVLNASFLVFDEALGREVLGRAPSVDFMFSMPGNDTHEGPVYVPDTHEFYFSRLEHVYLPQLVVNLSATPPRLEEKKADPPIYAGSGARYWKGSIIYSTIGGNESLDGHTLRPGIYELDPKTGKSRTLLNNYYGYYFNSADDLDIDERGRIWFTDNSESPLPSFCRSL